MKFSHASMSVFALLQGHLSLLCKKLHIHIISNQNIAFSGHKERSKAINLCFPSLEVFLPRSMCVDKKITHYELLGGKWVNSAFGEPNQNLP